MFGRKIGRPQAVPISLLRVDRCNSPEEVRNSAAGGEAMWMIVAAEDSTGEFETIQYGQVPPGYQETHRARPLTAGCYEVAVSAVAVARFILDNELRVRGEVLPTPN